MGLKTLVKVGNITNLSDARYAAGMGADMLGFSVIEGSDHYVNTPLYQQMRGWISGPKIVIELYGLTDKHDIKSIIENHVPDYAELTLREFKAFHTEIKVPCIVRVSEEDEMDHLPTAQIAYWLTDGLITRKIQGPIPPIITVRNLTELDAAMQIQSIAGVALNGSAEIRPGFKNYDDLAEILEKLED